MNEQNMTKEQLLELIQDIRNGARYNSQQHADEMTYLKKQVMYKVHDITNNIMKMSKPSMNAIAERLEDIQDICS